jgi:hypothetical protein
LLQQNSMTSFSVKFVLEFFFTGYFKICHTPCLLCSSIQVWSPCPRYVSMIVSSSLVASSSSQRFSWVSFSLQTSATASLDDGLGFF